VGRYKDLDHLKLLNATRLVGHHRKALYSGAIDSTSHQHAKNPCRQPAKKQKQRRTKG
jgi:hypothetical protein